MRLTSIKTTIETRFHCEHCDVYRRVRVEAIGQGATNSLQSHETGEQRALDDAQKQAEQTLLFLACPECGKASSKGEKLKTRLLLSYFVLLPLVIVVPALIYGWAKNMSDDAMVLLVGISALCGLGASAMSYFTRQQPWDGAGKRVEVLPPKAK